MKISQLTRYIVILVSICIPFLVFSSNNYFSYSGIALAFMLISLFSFIYSDKKLVHIVFFIISAVLAFFLVFRADSLLTIFNLIGLIYSISFLISSPESNDSSNILKLIILPWKLFMGLTFATKDGFYDNLLSWKQSISNADQKSESKLTIFTFWKQLTSFKLSDNFLLQIAVTVLVLVFIVPLLASVNPVFQDIVVNIISNINFRFLSEYLNSILESIFTFTTVSRILIFIFLLSFLPGIVTKKDLDDEGFDLKLDKTNLLLPKVSTFLVVLGFTFTQIGLYLASSEYLESV
ncbi:MAG: DUF4153 domain-containing protein [Patescibacteria group bacterium]